MSKTQYEGGQRKSTVPSVSDNYKIGGWCMNPIRIFHARSHILMIFRQHLSRNHRSEMTDSLHAQTVPPTHFAARIEIKRIKDWPVPQRGRSADRRSVIEPIAIYFWLKREIDLCDPTETPRQISGREVFHHFCTGKFRRLCLCLVLDSPWCNACDLYDVKIFIMFTQ